MDKAAWKCITCGEFTYLPGCDAKTQGLEIRETIQCLQCVRDRVPVDPRLQERILAKYASGEY